MLRLVSGLVALAALLSSESGPRQSPSAQAVPPPPVSMDVVAVDRDGHPVDTLGPEDFTVTVDGARRRVLAVKHVSRGPGATESAALVAARAALITAAAEPIRNVLIVVDETLLERGDEPAAVRAGAAILDRLGLSDRVAIVRVPALSATSILLTTDRPSAREELRTVAGQIAAPASASDAPSRAEAPARADDTRAVAAGDPDKAGVAELPQIAANDVPAPASLSPETVRRIRESLGGVRQLLVSLRGVPGRKVVVLFSAGLPRGWNELVRDADLRDIAAAATSARTTMHVLGLRSSRFDSQAAPELAPYETLARHTGGTFVMLEKQADRTVERLMPSVASCYVLSVETTPADRDGKRRPLRVETARKGVTLRAPAAFVPADDPEDTVVALAPQPPLSAPPPEQPAVAGSNAAATKPPSGAPSRPEPPDAERRARDAEASLLLSRAIDYVAGYQKAFSAVVAQETYVQTAGTRRVGLVSDFLLVRSTTGNAWVSFRDVFQVNGERVRDRDERLKALFLANPNVEESAQLLAIKTESARYNIGLAERNVNVPLYALAILTPEHRNRFRFSLARSGQSSGVAVQRLEFEETARPTMVIDPSNKMDVPLRGSFAIDPLTGAVTESVLEALNPNVTGRLVVRYRRDPDLGLWVPHEMVESWVSRNGTRVAEAQATYEKFRRFQVKTEEKVAAPKR